MRDRQRNRNKKSTTMIRVRLKMKQEATNKTDTKNGNRISKYETGACEQTQPKRVRKWGTLMGTGMREARESMMEAMKGQTDFIYGKCG